MVGPILKGEDYRFTPIDKGLGEYFFEQAEKFGDKVFQIDGDTGNQQTYQDIRTQATRTALYLKNLGIKQNDVVLLCSKNSQYEIVAVLAGLFLGAYISAVDANGSTLETKYLINLVEPKLIFVPNDRIELIEQSIRELPKKPIMIAIGDTKGKYTDMLEIKKNNEENNFKPVPQKGSDTCAIVFSSGSSSLPKGICVNNASLFNGAFAHAQFSPYIVSTKPTCFMQFPKFNYIGGWMVTGTVIATGTTKVISNKLNAEHFLKLVQKYNITAIFTTNALVHLITALDEDTIKKYDTSSLLVMGVLGSALDANKLLQLRKYLPHTKVSLSYGSSELCGISARDYRKENEGMDKLTSSGSVIAGVQLKVVDLDTEELLGPNKTGEIRVINKYMFNGFWKQSVKEVFDQEGWYKTGYVGYYDQDGCIYIVDRIRSMFKYATSQISPTFMELAILQHPKVAEAVAFGLPHEIDINRPAACVVLKTGVTATVEEIIEFVNSKVSDAYRVRGGLMILDEIPKLSSGKYHTRLVKENFIKINQLNGS